MGLSIVAIAVYGLCLAATLLTGVLAAVSDIRSLTIPNKDSVIVVVLFVVGYGVLAMAGAAPGPWWGHLISMAIIFVVTLLMFVTGTIGGGDAKFGTACALWAGLKGLAPFLLVMGVVGALLAVLALIMRGRVLFPNAHPDSWIGQVQAGTSATPYGVAIMSGLCAALWSGGMLNPVIAFLS